MKRNLDRYSNEKPIEQRQVSKSEYKRDHDDWSNYIESTNKAYLHTKYVTIGRKSGKAPKEFR